MSDLQRMNWVFKLSNELNEMLPLHLTLNNKTNTSWSIKMTKTEFKQ